MEIHYECTVEDYVDAQRTQLRTQAVYYVLLVLGPLFIIVGLLLVRMIRLGAWPVVAVGVAYLLWPLVLFPIRVRRDFRKHPHIAEPKVLRADSEGIWVEGVKSRSENKWSLYTRFRETPRVFMLYVGPRNFMIIPKAAFSAAELDQFRALARQNLPAK